MRWLACVVATSALLGAAADLRAEAPGRDTHARLGPVPFRVVKILPDTRQALLYDRQRRSHVLITEGDQVGDYQVTEVDEGHLVVRRGDRELILVVDPNAPRPSGPVPTTGAAQPAAPTPSTVLLDPYPAPPVTAAPAAGGPSAPSAVLDPYTSTAFAIGAPGSGGVREVLAPPDQRVASPPAPPAAAPGAPAPSAPATLDPYAAAPASPGPTVVTALPAIGPATPTVPAPSTSSPSTPAPATLDPYGASGVAPPAATPLPPAPRPPVAAPTPAPTPIRFEPMIIKRAELEAALADFAKLGRDIGFTKVADGVRLGDVAPGSYFHRMGLRSGDVVTSIDGAPLRSLDDAALAYAQLGSARKLSLGVARSGTTGSLRFVLR